MSKKIVKVNGEYKREITEFSFPTFYSKHSEEDIREWLQEVYSYEVNQRLSKWEYNYGGVPEQFKDWKVSEQVLNFEPKCEFDDEIQKFIDIQNTTVQ